ncbi:tetratricopeptide repeat protein [Pseudemcibacter aquimaris]|uniref:tetratricopeptide repeat protein n=1 Tax=Pseudemcibacter aquimaris TaxID=2857064 RepID=UPI0020132030|nr:tetratricopeptide repeat protein [Pseudemcibacter aquimaris]MCC3862147.1 hypothetical protein [Pseudemcibacter aquimaris]WDU58900.1 hypothetical protein KW060_01255 [Pseudemcibacter aquimaris]
MFKLSKKLYLSIVSLLFVFSVAEIANAQSLATSTGRTNGVTMEFSNNNYRSLKKMRSLMMEGKHEKAADRAIKFIRSSEGNERNGVEKTDYVKEAYNILCVASTSLRKVEYALDACNKSIAYNPDHWESLKSRATLYFMTQDFEKSLADFKLAHENSPNDEIGNVLAQNISVVESKLQ